MTDIFLSYNEKDRDAARRMAAVLDAVGWTVWWDRRIPAGESWRSVLEKALGDMRCMVVLWSRHSIASEWVFEEASEGRRQHKLFPVLIEDVRPPTGFREIQAADLSAWDGSPDDEALRLLIGDLEAFLGKPPAGGKAPAGDAVSAAAGESPNGSGAIRRWPYTGVHTWAAAGAVIVAGAAGFAYLDRSPRAPSTPSASTADVRPAPPGAAGPSPSASAALVPSPSVSSALVPSPSVSSALVPSPSVSSALVPSPGVSSALVPSPGVSAALVPSPSVSAALVPSPSAPPAASSHASAEPPTRTSAASVPAAGAAAGSRAANGARAATRRVASRCADLLARMQLGEPLAAAEQTTFREECRR